MEDRLKRVEWRRWYARVRAEELRYYEKEMGCSRGAERRVWHPSNRAGFVPSRLFDCLSFLLGEMVLRLVVRASSIRSVLL